MSWIEDERALGTYIHGPDYYEKDEEGIQCKRCECYIPADERYYEMDDGQIYCKECMDDLYGKTNWV